MLSNTNFLSRRAGMRAAFVLTTSLAMALPPLTVNAAEIKFSSRKQAEAYLAKTLPAATARNPKYLTKADGTETVWLTKSIVFASLPGGRGVEVATEEHYAQTKDGKTTPNTHRAKFALADVDISEHSNPDDVTPSGEPAIGVSFKCTTPKCILAHWGGQASQSDWTDVYLQEPEVRAKVLAAFQFLKGAH